MIDGDPFDALDRAVAGLAAIYGGTAMTYELSPRSLDRLHGVHPDLVRVVMRAISTTTQDFAVQQGLRTLEEQKRNVAKGNSRTMKSRHLTGHAVDLVPWIDGALKWDWPAIYKIASAMRGAAIAENVPIRFGGVWDRRLNELPGDPAGIKLAVEAYAKRHPGSDLLDGPHYELPREVYP